MNESPYAVEGQPSVLVDLAYFRLIQKDSDFLECLDACGVLDWEGYKEANEMYEEERE